MCFCYRVPLVPGGATVARLESSIKELKQRCIYRWEDQQNKHGGKWVLQVKDREVNRNYINKIWELVLIGLVSEQIDFEDEICGAVFSRRAKGASFTWGCFLPAFLRLAASAHPLLLCRALHTCACLMRLPHAPASRACLPSMQSICAVHTHRS